MIAAVTVAHVPKVAVAVAGGDQNVDRKVGEKAAEVVTEAVMAGVMVAVRDVARDQRNIVPTADLSMHRARVQYVSKEREADRQKAFEGRDHLQGRRADRGEVVDVGSEIIVGLGRRELIKTESIAQRAVADPIARVVMDKVGIAGKASERQDLMAVTAAADLIHSRKHLQQGRRR